MNGYEFDMNGYESAFSPCRFSPWCSTTFHQSRAQEFTTKLDGKVDNVAWKEVCPGPAIFEVVTIFGNQKTDHLEDW